MDDDALLRVCHGVVDAVSRSLHDVQDWRPAGERPGQYAIDLVADRAALDVLQGAGLGVLSEESGAQGIDAEYVAVLDPVDGSTNASRGVPWYATSICVVDRHGPRAAVVANLATGVRYQATRGGGAWRDGVRLRTSGCADLHESVVALSGYPSRHLGWAQFRAFGAAALDLCAVADGTVDAFSAVGRAHLGAWDYLGGVLVCTEAGAAVADLDGGELVTFDHSARRAVAAGASTQLLGQLSGAVLGARSL
ncbi:MAG TPA: inositol monophosphatase family protein [Acidimicrobiales bacterium]|nr:inositol monophosphatase family protein [Acidimicrobiales bacterium]